MRPRAHRFGPLHALWEHKWLPRRNETRAPVHVARTKAGSGAANDGGTPDACRAEEGILLCWETGCLPECTRQMLGPLIMLCVVCMASHTFGHLLARAGFPAITLFLAFGVLAGPYGLDIVPSSSFAKLDWINDLALGFIGMSAGGKFHINEVRPPPRATVPVGSWPVMLTAPHASPRHASPRHIPATCHR